MKKHEVSVSNAEWTGGIHLKCTCGWMSQKFGYLVPMAILNKATKYHRREKRLQAIMRRDAAILRKAFKIRRSDD